MGTSSGRGAATGGSIAPAHASGTGATIAPARGISAGAAVAGGHGVGTGPSIAPARGVGAASTAGGRGVGRGVSIGGGRGIATGVRGSVPSIAPARIAPESPSAAPASRPLPAKQEKARPQSKEKVEKGALIEAPNPVYPAEAREQKIEGTVRVAIIIDENGKVVSARAKSGPGPLHTASQEAAYKARFKPAMINGKPAEVAATLSYNFVLSKN